jgi:hypothetical protein
MKAASLKLTDAASASAAVAALAGRGLSPAVLTLTPTSLTFATQSVGTPSAPQTLTVTNSGDLATSSIGVSGSSTDFIETNNCSTLGGGASCTITVTFKPTSFGMKSSSWTASATTGGSVVATASGVGQDTVTVSVALAGSGTGAVAFNGGAACSASPCTQSFTRDTAIPAVSITATPTGGSSFGGWSGACAGAAACALTLNGATAVNATATFIAPVPQLKLKVANVFTAGHGGSVSGGGINCMSAGVCNAIYTQSTQTFTLTASPNAESTFVGWGGDCSGATPQCTLNEMTAHNVTATFRPSANIAFVTSAALSIPFAATAAGAQTNADAFCNARARAGGLPGSYVAWLSTSGTNAISKLGSASGWVRSDGKPFTSDPASLASGVIYFPLIYDESGHDTTFTVNLVATGTNADGTLNATETCNDWTSTAGVGLMGAGFGSSAWTDRGTASCNGGYSLYCFENKFNATVNPAVNGRIIFISKGLFAPGPGKSLADADALCQSEARAPGTFLALLSTSTSAATSRLDLSASSLPFVRPDGTPIGATAADLNQGQLWVALDENADGSYISGEITWSGSSNPGFVGTFQNSCSDWGATTGGGVGGDSDRMLLWFSEYIGADCSQGEHVFCVQK